MQKVESTHDSKAMTRSMEKPLGLVVAGGQGRRCGGRDKAWLRLHGYPLVCHAVERLRPQVGQLVISANRHLWAYARLGMDCIADQPQWSARGPLAALASTWRRFPDAVLAIAPVDCPRAPRDQVQRLHEAVLAGAPAAALRTDGGLQPLFAVLDPALASAAEAALATSRPPSMRNWLDDAGVEWIDYPVADQEDPFVNINHLEDLDVLEAACRHQ